MTDYLVMLFSALWLGILTSISPCAMTTNIAAIAFVGRRVAHPFKTFLTGLLYISGRVLTYVVLGVLLSKALLSAPQVSYILQKYMNKALGPFLILIGMVLLDLISFKGSGKVVSEKMQKRIELMGLWGALPLGIIFALAFCPISAALFFSSLISISVRTGSVIMAPTFFGLGTGIPVLIFALIMAFSGKSLSKAFDKLSAVEKWARTITGSILILLGIYCSIRFIWM